MYYAGKQLSFQSCFIFSNTSLFSLSNALCWQMCYINAEVPTFWGLTDYHQTLSSTLVTSGF